MIIDVDCLPTYGELIDYFHQCEDDPENLFLKFKDSYPSVYVGRVDRFYKTVKQIALPTFTVPIVRGKLMSDAEILAYRRRVWKPRLHNTSKLG